MAPIVGPAQSSRPPPIVQIAAGGFAGYAALADGRVWAWGDDFEGQVGAAGAWRVRTTPVPVAGIDHVVALAGGANAAYALRRDGSLWAWGDGSERQLGDAADARRQRPVRVRTPDGIVAVAAGMFAAYALRRDGTVWAWGENAVGQLGTSGGDGPRGRPRRVAQLDRVTAIAAGAGDGYALRRDGTVWAWGDDSLGQLGHRSCADTRNAGRHQSYCERIGAPVRVQGVDRVASIAAGANTVYALRRDGTVWAWGDGSFGALGTGAGGTPADHPVRVTGLTHVVAIAAASDTGYAVLRDGTVRAWGRGSNGELGNGGWGDGARPSRVLGVTGAVRVAGGGGMAYALDRRGRLWAWGSGLYGQLGNGARVSIAYPTPVAKLSTPGT
jgi:alpha-tubulin suppressor-like RCC1 family protein